MNSPTCSVDRKKYIPNKYNRSDANRHQQKHTQNKSVGAKQHQNNSIQHSKGNSNKTGGIIPAKPFTGTCDHGCMKDHRIRDCRKASDSQKAEWLKKLENRQEKAARG